MAKTTGALVEQRTNLNILNSQFSVVFHRIKQISVEALKFETPDISSPQSKQPTTFGIDIPLHGNKIQYSEFSIKFKVDQKGSNYNTLLRWLKALAAESDFEQVEEEFFSEKELFKPTGSLYSDISIVPLTGKNLPSINWMFHSAFPVFLSGFSMDNTSDDSIEQVATARFAFETMELKPIDTNPTEPFFDTTGTLNILE